MKERLRQILVASVQETLPPFEIERPKVKAHGELSTNLAMILARQTKQNPQVVGQQILKSLKDPEGLIESASMAGGGFLNFTFKKKAWHEILHQVLQEGESFGKTKQGQGQRVVVEYVSANPTGPLHIGNARGGPLGDVISSLLQAVGYEVTREYYVNDVGGQIDKLGESILFYIQGSCDRPIGEFVIGKDVVGYQGEYVRDLAELAQKKLGDKIPREEREAVRVLGRFAIDRMIEEIKRDCDDMGIHFDSWIHEKDILATKTEKIIQTLKEKGVTLKKEGALWFAMGVVRGREDLPPDSSEASGLAGAERIDRECVLERSDGRPTYFANDIAYHVSKYKKGYDRLINIWGSNHHGHVPRVQAAVKSLGYDPKKIETVLYQYVRVKRGTEAVKMSKRGGNFVTAREVLDEVGRDAFRFFLLMRAPESHLDFDLALATKHSSENPVYYVQYAHARLASIMRKAAEMGIPEPTKDTVLVERLELPEEIEMIRLIHEYPEEVLRAAEKLEPHRLTFYLLELSKLFQAYYTKAREDPRYRVLTADIDTSRAKMYLGRALKLTLFQGLQLLGISAPEVMIQEG